MFEVIQYTLRNCCNNNSSFSPPSAFLNAHLNVSTKHSAWSLDIGWNKAFVTSLIKNSLQKSPNTLAINCVPLSDTIVSETTNLAKISWKKFIVLLYVGILHFATS